MNIVNVCAFMFIIFVILSAFIYLLDILILQVLVKSLYTLYAFMFEIRLFSVLESIFLLEAAFLSCLLFFLHVGMLILYFQIYSWYIYTIFSNTFSI